MLDSMKGKQKKEEPLVHTSSRKAEGGFLPSVSNGETGAFEDVLAPKKNPRASVWRVLGTTGLQILRTVQKLLMCYF